MLIPYRAVFLLQAFLRGHHAKWSCQILAKPRSSFNEQNHSYTGASAAANLIISSCHCTHTDPSPNTRRSQTPRAPNSKPGAPKSRIVKLLSETFRDRALKEHVVNPEVMVGIMETPKASALNPKPVTERCGKQQTPCEISGSFERYPRTSPDNLNAKAGPKPFLKATLKTGVHEARSVAEAQVLDEPASWLGFRV